MIAPFFGLQMNRRTAHDIVATPEAADFPCAIVGASPAPERCGCDESIALRAPQSVGIAEKIERLREDAAHRAREWRRYGHEFEAIEWDAVARWLGSVK